MDSARIASLVREVLEEIRQSIPDATNEEIGAAEQELRRTASDLRVELIAFGVSELIKRARAAKGNANLATLRDFPALLFGQTSPGESRRACSAGDSAPREAYQAPSVATRPDGSGHRCRPSLPALLRPYVLPLSLSVGFLVLSAVRGARRSSREVPRV